MKPRFTVHGGHGEANMRAARRKQRIGHGSQLVQIGLRAVCMLETIGFSIPVFAQKSSLSMIAPTIDPPCPPYPKLKNPSIRTPTSRAKATFFRSPIWPLYDTFNIVLGGRGGQLAMCGSWLKATFFRKHRTPNWRSILHVYPQVDKRWGQIKY